MRAQTRHQLKQDKFNRVTMGAAEATVHWTVEHQTKLLAAAGLLALLIAAAIGAWYYNNQRNDQANLAIDEAVRTLQTPLRPLGTPPQPESPSFASENERATTARKQFQDVAANFPHTHTAQIALYFLGVTDNNLGNTGNAESEFKEVASVHDKDVSALANFALASLYRNTNRNTDAIEIYKKLIDKPTTAVGKSTAQMALAETYQAAGQVTEAKRILQQVQKENNGTEIAQMASQKLLEIH